MTAVRFYSEGFSGTSGNILLKASRLALSGSSFGWVPSLLSEGTESVG